MKLQALKESVLLVWRKRKRELEEARPLLEKEIARLVQVERHGNEIDSFDVEAVLAFAKYVVLNARRLWEEFPLELRRRMQKVLFPEGLVWSDEAFRTPVNCLFFRDLERPEIELEKVVDRTGFEPRTAGAQPAELATGCRSLNAERSITNAV